MPVGIQLTWRSLVHLWSHSTPNNCTWWKLFLVIVRLFLDSLLSGLQTDILSAVYLLKHHLLLSFLDLILRR